MSQDGSAGMFAMCIQLSSDDAGELELTDFSKLCHNINKLISGVMTVLRNLVSPIHQHLVKVKMYDRELEWRPEIQKSVWKCSS